MTQKRDHSISRKQLKLASQPVPQTLQKNTHWQSGTEMTRHGSTSQLCLDQRLVFWIGFAGGGPSFTWWGCCGLYLVSISVFIALSTTFHSISSPQTSPPSHSVLLALFLLYLSFQPHNYLFMKGNMGLYVLRNH